MRTIEVLPKKTNPHGRHVGWVIKATGTEASDKIYDKKKDAVKDAKRLAKSRAAMQKNSVGVKIFAKDGEYQRQHVYEP